MQKLVIGSLVAGVALFGGTVVFLGIQLGNRGEQVNALADLAQAVPARLVAEEAAVPASDAPVQVAGAAENQKTEKETVSEVVQSKEEQKTPEPPKPAAEAPKPAPAPKVPEPPKVVPAPVVLPDAPFKFDPAWRDAVVNLYCYSSYGDGHPSGGSGVIIDPRGIILTNAHVALDFLFYDTPKISSGIDCSVRTGSPASPVYRAKLIYLPAGYINEDVATVGKYVAYEDQVFGRDDYALLAITKPTDPHGTLPASFPSLSLASGPLPVPGSPVYLIGYPASFLGSTAYMKDLSQFASPATVYEIRSIKVNISEDILAFKGSIASQHGSSGGAVIGKYGKLVALPTFFDEEGQGASTADAVTNAITVDYINRDLKGDTGYSLAEFIARDTPEALLKAFLTEKAPVYHKQYVDAAAKASKGGGTILIVPGGY